jgi:ubiquinone/menaquinone biosynthesis C-methylase UbiE
MLLNSLSLKSLYGACLIEQVRDYEELLAEAVRVLKPGGSLLVVEIEWVISSLTGDSTEERMPKCYK